MADQLYYCTNENNNCINKETCKRYINPENDECHATLFKTACTEDNNYILYMKTEDSNER